MTPDPEVPVARTNHGTWVFPDDVAAQVACAWWQERLRLSDWDVIVRIVPRRGFSTEEPYAAGEVYEVRPKRLAMVRLVTEDDYPPDSLLPQDHECTLVHELLHLYTTPMMADPPSDAARLAEEQGINAVARALVDSRRNERRAESKAA